MKKLTQKDRVLRHLQEHGSINATVAIHEYGITQLGARIFELEHQDGLFINRVWKKAKNRYGETINYVEYVLKGETK